MQDKSSSAPVEASGVSRIADLERRISNERRLLGRYYGYPPSDHAYAEHLIRQLVKARKAEAGRV